MQMVMINRMWMIDDGRSGADLLDKYVSQPRSDEVFSPGMDNRNIDLFSKSFMKWTTHLLISLHCQHLTPVSFYSQIYLVFLGWISNFSCQGKTFGQNRKCSERSKIDFDINFISPFGAQPTSPCPCWPPCPAGSYSCHSLSQKL